MFCVMKITLKLIIAAVFLLCATLRVLTSKNVLNTSAKCII